MLLFDLIHQNIGIYYKNVYWKDKIFETIVKEAEECHLLRNYEKERISLIDNTIILFCKIDEPDRYRGQKYGKVFYQDDIEKDKKEIINTIILPHVIKKILPL